MILIFMNMCEIVWDWMAL